MPIATPVTGSAPSNAAGLYVSVSGNDQAAGTIGAPLASIERAIEIAKPGDVIYVRGGVYKGPLEIWNGGRDGAPIQIKAYPGERPIIDGSGTAPNTDLVVISAPHVTFEGFEVTNATGTGIVLWSTQNVKILNNVIHDAQIGGLWAGSDRLGVSSNHVFEGNIIFNTALMNKAKTLQEGWPRALGVDQTTDSVVRDNIVFKNYGEGIGALSSTDLRLTDNVVYDNFSVQMYLDNTQDITATGNLLFQTGDAEFYKKGRPGNGVLIANEYTRFEMPTERLSVQGNTYSGVETARYDGSYGRGGGIRDSVLGPDPVLARDAMLARAAETFRDGVPAWLEDYLLDTVGGTGAVSGDTGGAPTAPTGAALPLPVLSDKDGASTLIGTAGNDTFTVSIPATKVQAGQGLDVVQASVSWVMSEGVEVLQLTGSGAINGTGTRLDDSILGNAAANLLEGLDGNDRLTGNGGNDVLRGGNGNDTLAGGEGNDTLEGNAGTDRLEGGAGDDTYILSADASDTVVETSQGGTDLVRASVTVTLAANVENLVLTGSAAADGTGNTLANTITGNDAANTLSGGSGRDILLGAGGQDKLSGGGMRDLLNGGAGVDTLTGGSSNDVFRFATLAEAGDIITDFRDYVGNNDAIQINAAGFGGDLTLGVLAADRFQARADNLAQDLNDRFIFRTTDKTLWFDRNGSADGGLSLVADLDAGARLTSADILIY